MGRANAGKTTILEKVCHVAQGTKTIIYDEHGVKMKGSNSKIRLPKQIKKLLKIPLLPSLSPHLKPSLEVSCMVELMDHPLICNWQFQRGIHNIEHQITYPGSDFIFHDSQGFEAGGSKEIETVWNFIEKRSTAVEMKDRLHAIWYLILALYILDDQRIHIS